MAEAALDAMAVDKSGPSKLISATDRRAAADTVSTARWMLQLEEKAKAALQHKLSVLERRRAQGELNGLSHHVIQGWLNGIRHLGRPRSSQKRPMPGAPPPTQTRRPVTRRELTTKDEPRRSQLTPVVDKLQWQVAPNAAVYADSLPQGTATFQLRKEPRGSALDTTPSL